MKHEFELSLRIVTSLAEVWIETSVTSTDGQVQKVTSLAEVWIETTELDYFVQFVIGHFPCGSVD